MSDLSDNNIQVYEVKSKTDPSKKYKITHFVETDKWVCTCPSYIFHDEGFECKHIIALKKSLHVEPKQL